MAIATHKIISADSHIIEPPDLYANRIEARFRERAPRMERVETPAGRYDIFVTRPISATLLAVGAVLVLLALRPLITRSLDWRGRLPVESE